MALVNIREVYPGVSLGLWQMTETVEELLVQYPMLDCYRNGASARYKSDNRKLEFLAVRALLHKMLLLAGLTEKQIENLGDITHNEAGKPLLRGFHVSVSHTKGYAALILSRQKEVAVDIEYISGRVERVISKFLRKDEKATGLDELLVHWCAKETVFKLFSAQHLQFLQMRVKPFNIMADWICLVENMKDKQVTRVDFELTMEFVLTYSAK